MFEVKEYIREGRMKKIIKKKKNEKIKIEEIYKKKRIKDKKVRIIIDLMKES